MNLDMKKKIEMKSSFLSITKFIQNLSIFHFFKKEVSEDIKKILSSYAPRTSSNKQKLILKIFIPGNLVSV
jgi:hypothetical protein